MGYVLEETGLLQLKQIEENILFLSLYIRFGCYGQVSLENIIY